MGLEQTLQEQYNKTLQGTIGQSQRERLKSMRAVSGQSGTTDPSTDWAARQASGFRGAGFNPVSLSNIPQEQIQTTKDTFGGVAGGYVEGGKNLEGFYGETNPYSTEGSDTLFKNAGFTKLGKTSDLDLTYANIVPEVANNIANYEGAGNAGYLYGKNGADPSKIAVTQGPTLQESLSKLYNEKMLVSPSQQWQAYNEPLPESVYNRAPTNKMDVLYSSFVNPANLSVNEDLLTKAGLRKNPMYNPYGFTIGLNNNTTNTNEYEKLVDDFTFNGSRYATQAEGESAKTNQLAQYQNISKPQQSELLSQLLTQGAITGRSLGERGSFGGNNINDVITGELQKLFGSKDINYNGKNYGTILDMAGYDTPLQSQWADQNTSTERKWYGPTKTTTTWDQGASNLYRSLNNSEWWSQNAKNMGDGQILLTPEQLASSPGFSSVDKYVRDSGSKTQKRGILQKLWEVSSPTSLLLQQDFAKMQPIGAAVGNAFIPGLGSALNALDSYSKGDGAGGAEWLKGAAMSYAGGQIGSGVGANAGGGSEAYIDAGGMGGTSAGSNLGGAASSSLGGTIGNSTGLGTTVGNAIVSGGMSGLGALLNGGNSKNILTAIASGGLGSSLGSAVSNGFGGYLGDFAGQGSGQTAGNIAGSAANQGLQNLLTNNKFGKNMGMAAVQGGLSSLGNLFAPKGSTPEQVKSMNKLGTSAGGLAKTLYNKQKTKVK